MAELRFTGLNLLAIFGGQTAMIESPFILRVQAQVHRENILGILKVRFGRIPRDVAKDLAKVVDTKKLRKLVILAAKCHDLDAFRNALLS